MKKALSTILFVIYAIIAITVTVLLLSYNEYHNSQLGGYTVYIVKDDSLEPKYKQGSILLIKSTNDKNVQVGDEMFLYKVINTSEYEVVNATLQAKTQQGRHIVYIVGEEESYVNDYFIGKASDTVVIEGWGYVLSLLESKWGYLFCVVVVSLLLFLQEVFELAMEVKYIGDKNKKKKKVAVKVEEDEDDEVEKDEEEIEVKPIKKAAPKTTKTTTSTKTGGTKKTSTTTKKTGTSSKTGKSVKTTAHKTSETKSAKEEE